MSTTKDQYDTEQQDAQADRTQMANNQKAFFGVDSVDVTQMANQVKDNPPPDMTLIPDGSTMDQFAKDAPSNLKFNLPFGLGKLFNLPGYRQEQEEDQDKNKGKT